jgi:hypothetical protein
MTTRRLRRPQPKPIVICGIPVDFAPEQLRAIETLAARNSLSVEEQVILLVGEQLGLPAASAARLAIAA